MDKRYKNHLACWSQLIIRRVSATQVEISFTGKASDHVSPDKDNPRVETVKLNLKNLLKPIGSNPLPDLGVVLKIQYLPENLIYNARELQKINDHLKTHFVLANNIDLKGYGPP